MDEVPNLPTPKPDNPALPIFPPALPFASVVLAVTGEWLLPLHFLQMRGANGWQFWFGLLALIGGLGLGLSGIAAFRRAGTHVEPHKPALRLVTTGPYRFTRNPMYWGFLLLVAGLSLVFSLEWGLILLVLLWLALDRMIVAREERYLAAKFGDGYALYRRQTRRWL